MSRIIISAVVLALLGGQSVMAAGTTPPGPWMTTIKDAIREKLKSPNYVTFRRIFFVKSKTDDGAVPVCGFVNFKDKEGDHPAKQPFFGLLTPPDAGKSGTFASIQLGVTPEQTKEIAKTCKNYGVY